MSKRQKQNPCSQQQPRPLSACFEFVDPQANAVCIAGSFNDWHPDVTPMIRVDEGKWVKELTLPPGRYEYRFVVDGVWTDDPGAKESVENPFSGLNAVLEVQPAVEVRPGPSPSSRKDSSKPVGA